MKKLVLLAMICFGMSLSSATGYAEESNPGSFAIGLHGLNGQYRDGHPMLRWKPSDGWALDITPIFDVEDSHDTSMSSSGTDETSNLDYHRTGLNIRAVRQFMSTRGILLGWGAELGFSLYQYHSVTGGAAPSFITSDYNRRQRSLEVGFGPDLEWFVSTVPGLSVGASGKLHYRYDNSKRYYTSTSYSSVETMRSKTWLFLGELLTVRYYF